MFRGEVGITWSAPFALIGNGWTFFGSIVHDDVSALAVRATVRNVRASLPYRARVGFFAGAGLLMR